MPRVTEYSCRLKDPKRFQQKTFRTIASGDVHLIVARPYGKTKLRAQAIRYPREQWNEKSARQSCRKHKGKFEPVQKPHLGNTPGKTTARPTKKNYPYYPYDVVKHQGKWFMIGHTGGRYWIPIGAGYRTKKEAVARAKHQLSAGVAVSNFPKADKDAKRLVREV